MAKLTEIEDGESVGIGLAGSELPRRRRARRRRAERSGEDDDDGDGDEDARATDSTRSREYGRLARRYVAVSALLAFAMVVLKRAASYACVVAREEKRRGRARGARGRERVDRTRRVL